LLETADVLNSGRQDLFVTTVLGGNVLFKNDGRSHFVDITKEAGLDLVSHSSGAVFFDYDNDGRMDLLITDMHSDMMGDLAPDHEKEKIASRRAESFLAAPADRFIFGNTFYHSLGGDKFEEISDRIGVETCWPWGVSTETSTPMAGTIFS